MIDWLRLTPAGIHCVPGGFFVDPSTPVSCAVVSHAHADHYPRYSHIVHATPETLALGVVRYAKNAAKTPIAHRCGEPFSIGSVKVTLLHAGHILGSAQVLLEYNGQRALYTGDIDFDVNPTCEPLEYPAGPIDWMICESTFGLKEQHPDPALAMEAMLLEAGKKSIIIGVYSLGKAQRINRLLEKLRPELPVFVDSTIVPIHKAYQAQGVSPGKHLPYRRQDVKKLYSQFVWLLPPRKIMSFQRDRFHHKVFASGWDKTDKSAWLNGLLEISDHASQTELLQYVRQVRPKAVRFCHGYPETLIASCLADGIDAGELRLEP